MAIQGYTNTSSYLLTKLNSVYGPNANDFILTEMMEVLGVNISPTQAKEFMADVLERANKSNYPNLLTEDGILDMGLLYKTGDVPSIFQECDVVGIPDGTFHAMIIRGRWTIIASLDAYTNLMAQVAQNMPTEIIPPEITFLSSNFGIGVDWRTGATGVADVVSFCATFYTKYGETGPSNTLMSPLTDVRSWTCQIGLVKEPHSLVKAIYFYRTFSGTFRRVKEVIISE